MRPSVSRNFRSFILVKYPALFGNEPFMRFFRYLCFGDFIDRDAKRLVIPTKKMAEDFYQQDYSCHFKGLDVLEEFRAKVLPTMTWSSHQATTANSWRGKARQITNLGFDQKMQDALRSECLNPSEDQVDLVTGARYERSDRYRDRANETQAYERDLAAHTLNPTQASILDYLRNIHDDYLFIPKLNANKDAIEEAIARLPREVQGMQYRILANVHHNPNVYYLPSSQERTCRLSPKGDSLLGLKREVRKAATKGWWECDLRSSQFAILAAKLQAPISQEFIASGKSLWRELYAFLSGTAGEPPGEVKAVMKEAVYSVCYGKSKVNLKEFLAQHGMVKLLKHPIFVELLMLRRAWFDEITRSGGAHDVWGQWHALDDKNGRWAGSIGATLIQAIEMDIIAPVFDVTARYGNSHGFRICLFQHDGCTMSFRAPKKLARAQRKLKEAVEGRAKELGVNTVLEFTQL